MKSPDRFGYFLALVCFFGLPALAVGLITFFACQFAAATGSSVWVAGAVGFVVGTVFVGAMIASSGTDMTDFAVSSVIVIILTLILMPVFQRARQNSHKRALRQQRALQQTPSPNPTQKRAPRQ